MPEHLFSDYEPLQTKVISTVSRAPTRPPMVETEMAEEEGSEMAGPVRASPMRSAAALFRLTYASAPVVLLKI